MFILVQRKLIGCGFKPWFGAARLGCVLWIEPCKGLITKTSDGHRELVLVLLWLQGRIMSHIVTETSIPSLF